MGYRYPGALRAPRAVGGFVFVRAGDLIAAWWRYRLGGPGAWSFIDFRAWLALREHEHRRVAAGRPASRRPDAGEVARVMGAASAPSLRRALGLPLGPDAWRSLPCPIEGVNLRRPVPVPRRLLRAMARSAKPALVATALGHLLRCLYFRKGECVSGGLCRSGWVADVFGVDERSVKRARGELERAGVLSREATPQRVMNRHGVRVRVELGWDGLGLSPRRRPERPRLSPPRENRPSLSERSGNQTPPPRRARPGARVPRGEGAATLRAVRESDLRTPDRLDALWREAARAGLAGAGEAGRLAVHAAAARALRCASRNAPGFFAAVLHRGLWGHLSAADEDRARASLRDARQCGLAHTRRARDAKFTGGMGVAHDAAAVRTLVARSLASVASHTGT